MGVIVDLDPLRRCRQIKGVSDTFKKVRLGCCLCQFPRQRFARIAQRPIDQLCFFATFGDHDINFTPQLPRQRLDHQIGAFDVVRQDQLTRWFAGVIELTDKGLQHLGGIHIRAHTGVVVAVPPVLVSADKEDLHASLPLIQVQRDNIRFRNALRVDPLCRLHLRQRLDPVAQGGGAFKLHRL